MRAALLVVALLSGCLGDAAAVVTAELELRVRTDNGAAVRGAIILVDATSRGETDADGIFRTRTRGAPGQRVRVDVKCPAGFRPRADGLEAVLRRAGDDEQVEVSRLALDAECLPTNRLGVLVVRAVGAPSLPILINGERSGETGATGIAHVPVKLVPGTALRVTLDTSSTRALRPQNPTQRFAIEDRDAVLLVDQSFSAAPKRKFHRHRAAPYRID